MPTIMNFGVGFRYEQSGCGVTSPTTVLQRLRGFRVRTGRSAVLRPGAALLAGAVAVGLVFSGVPAYADPVTPVAPVAAISCATTPAQAPVVLATSGSAAGVYAGVLLTGAQVDAANTVVNVGLDQGITRRGIAIAIAAAMQASSLRPTAGKLAYVGLFQQRSDASSQLYTQQDRSDPVGASRMFFDQLVVRVPGYESDPRSDAEIADAVQESGDIPLITNWLPMAQALTDTFVPAPAAEPVAPELKPAMGRKTPIVSTYALANPLPLRTSGVAFRADPTDTEVPSTTAATTASRRRRHRRAERSTSSADSATAAVSTSDADPATRSRRDDRSDDRSNDHGRDHRHADADRH